MYVVAPLIVMAACLLVATSSSGFCGSVGRDGECLQWRVHLRSRLTGVGTLHGWEGPLGPECTPRLCFLRRYVLANIETKGGVRRGDRVWQIAFGSGFKCNSAIWRALRNINTQHSVWI